LEDLLEVLHQVLACGGIEDRSKLYESFKFFLKPFFCYADVALLHVE